MKREQEQVKQFMIKAGQETPSKPKIPQPEVLTLRVKLILEELCELADECGIKFHREADGSLHVFSSNPDKPIDLVEVYDGILDIMVVTIGAGVAFGLDLEPGWNEVDRSNMSKFIDGHRREDGKWVKGPSYSPANLEPIVEGQFR